MNAVALPVLAIAAAVIVVYAIVRAVMFSRRRVRYQFPPEPRPPRPPETPPTSGKAA